MFDRSHSRTRDPLNRVWGTSILIASAIFGLSHLASAQMEVPVRVVLEGTENRQITGLADPASPDAAISLGALRASAVSFTDIQGTSNLSGALIPAPISYSTGMVVTVLPAVANAPGPTLDLNGLGARPIIKQGNLPLDSADLEPGIPVRLIYDGSRFQLIGSTALPCPIGSTAVGREYCIDDQSQGAVTFFIADVVCAGRGARLCTISEWSHACRKLTGFLGTVISAEWVDHAANNSNGAKLVGAGSDGSDDLPGTSCQYGGQSPPYNQFRFRCCAHR